ncbi:MAG: hypothetical protein FJ186_04125 [Gammaproteobacteria bacterium]|jgi:chorismate-pyruvate lyase|nr:hypothetical protein [Gammaproteobacteria bacterium]
MQDTSVNHMDQWTTQLSNIVTNQPTLEAWLSDPSSTTQKFNSLGISVVYQIKNASINIPNLWPDFLSTNPISRAVDIQIKELIFMQAHSLISPYTMLIKQKIQTLNNAPLGHLLFAQNDLTRSNFYFCKGHGPFIHRLSRFHSKNLRCILLESFNSAHPFFNEAKNG